MTGTRVMRPVATAAAVAQNGSITTALPGRREVLALAAVLTATVLTMAAAVAGLTRKTTPSPVPTQTVKILGQVPATPPRVEPGD